MGGNDVKISGIKAAVQRNKKGIGDDQNKYMSAMSDFGRPSIGQTLNVSLQERISICFDT